MNVQVAKDRDALYYPFFHIQNLDWLKGALLCFPHVHRMIPYNVIPMDPQPLRDFCSTRGIRNEFLLQPADLMIPAVVDKQRLLLSKLEMNADVLVQRYSRKATEKAPPRDGLGPVHIHTGKIDNALTDFLRSVDLAWDCTGRPWPQDIYPQEITQTAGAKNDLQYWVSLHPWLGSAIMSTIAVAVAEEMGYDIVTDRPEVHRWVVSCDDVVDMLVGGNRPESSEVTVDDAVDRIAQLVIVANFDVNKLTPERIADLQQDGCDLRRFKNALVPLAEAIPKMTNEGERDKRLKEAANETISEWHKYKRSLPRFALDAITEAATNIKVPDLSTSILSSGVTYKELGLASGIAVFLMTYAGLGIWRKYRMNVASPYQFLNRIHKAHLSLALPVQ